MSSGFGIRLNPRKVPHEVQMNPSEVSYSSFLIMADIQEKNKRKETSANCVFHHEPYSVRSGIIV